MRSPTMVFIAALVTSSSLGAEVTVLRGNEPLRENLNAEKDAVRVLFIGAPS